MAALTLFSCEQKSEFLNDYNKAKNDKPYPTYDQYVNHKINRGIGTAKTRHPEIKDTCSKLEQV